jgi:hypothetical protein
MFYINMVLGLLLIIAPFALSYSNNPVALWSSVVIGAIIALASGYKAFAKDTNRWEDWVDVLAGLVAVATPFVFGFSTMAAAMFTFIILGLIVALLSAYDLYVTNPVAR